MVRVSICHRVPRHFDGVSRARLVAHQQAQHSDQAKTSHRDFRCRNSAMHRSLVAILCQAHTCGAPVQIKPAR